ncbi:DUF998 domain-containing protein [Amycolatopsis magusensis]|nr:DUF998 domain-containing protein [Amycolatopsis magusensis]
MGVAVLIAIHLHIRLSAEVSPLWRTLSEYVNAGAAPIFGVMCLALAAGSLALLVGIARARRGGAVPVLLGFWCAGLVVCGLVPVDADGAARTLSGQLHNGGAVLAFLSLPLAGWLLTRRSDAHCPWEPRRTTIRRLSVASAVTLGVVLASFAWIMSTGPADPVVTLGLFERVLFAVDLALLLTMTRPLLSSARR